MVLLLPTSSWLTMLDHVRMTHRYNNILIRAVHWNGAATDSYVRDALLVLLLKSELADDEV
jgi:hypothetical protein